MPTWPSANTVVLRFECNRKEGIQRKFKKPLIGEVFRSVGLCDRLKAGRKMKKPNRRSKQASVVDSSPSVCYDKKHYEKRIHDLETENEAFRRELEELQCKLSDGLSASDNSVQKWKQHGPQKLLALEGQVMQLKRKLNTPSQLSTQKNKNDEFRNEIQRLKAQKVQLLCKVKLESVQFRLCKASLEKEILQLKKEQRRNKYEMRKLLALNERQKLVLQRKTEEASVAAKRLKDLLEGRKTSSRGTAGSKNGGSPGTQAIERELEVAARVHEIRLEYERQMEEMAEEVRKFEEEAEMLKQENFEYMLQEKENDCRVKDSELRDLKEEVVRLSNLVYQSEISKARSICIEKPKVDLVRSSVSVGSTSKSLGMSTFGSGHSERNATSIDKTAPATCCSCSKKSLCKTMKCECRAAWAGCGTSCGCASSKCTNREVIAVKLDNPSQPEMAEEPVNSLSIREENKDLAPLGAMLLQHKLVEKPAEKKDYCGSRRKPLCDVGNKIKSNPVKPGQKKRRQKQEHLDNVHPTSSLPEDETAVLVDIPSK